MIENEWKREWGNQRWVGHHQFLMNELLDSRFVLSSPTFCQRPLRSLFLPLLSWKSLKSPVEWRWLCPYWSDKRVCLHIDCYSWVMSLVCFGYRWEWTIVFGRESTTDMPINSLTHLHPSHSSETVPSCDQWETSSTGSIRENSIVSCDIHLNKKQDQMKQEMEIRGTCFSFGWLIPEQEHRVMMR